MKLETGRLELAALTAEHLELWLTDIAALEKELGCVYRSGPVEPWFQSIIAGQAKLARADRENYLWRTFWFLIRKWDRTVVGSADFKCLPDENGEVEIGYGLESEFEGSGYMTEAVQAMCAWALEQRGVKHIIAETEAGNFASQRVLVRCGFQEYRREQTIWWRL